MLLCEGPLAAAPTYGSGIDATLRILAKKLRIAVKKLTDNTVRKLLLSTWDGAEAESDEPSARPSKED